MSIRKVKPYGNSDFIQKTIDIERKIPIIQSLDDLSNYEKEANFQNGHSSSPPS